MASREKDESLGFLSRWSQRKRAMEEGAELQETTAAKAEPAQQGQSEEDGGAGDRERIDPADLPDIETLDANSDFSQFMQKGVPEALKRRALRKLWQVDPAFSQICMLDDYNLDYTDAAMVVPNLKTLYQVGRGMILAGEDTAEAVEPPAAAAALEAAETSGVPAEAPAGAEQQAQAADAPAAPAAEATAASGSISRQPRKPGVPLVSASARPETGVPRSPRPTARTASRRRWGDTDG
jgi:hypothetical protein